MTAILLAHYSHAPDGSQTLILPHKCSKRESELRRTQGNRIESRLDRQDAKDAKEKRGEMQKQKNLHRRIR